MPGHLKQSDAIRRHDESMSSGQFVEQLLLDGLSFDQRADRHDQPRAAKEQNLGRLLADAAAGAGNDGNFAGEIVAVADLKCGG